MNKKTSILLIAITSIAFMSSCTMEKRLYMPGYNVEWNKSGNSEEKVNIASNVSSASQEQTTDNNSLSTGNTDNILTEENLSASINNSQIISGAKAKQKNALLLNNFENTKKEKLQEQKFFPVKHEIINAKPAGEGEGTNGLAIASLIFGIAGIVLLFVPEIAVVVAALIASILAIIFGFIGLGKSKGKGFAIAGLVLGFIGIAIWLLVIAIVASFAY